MKRDNLAYARGSYMYLCFETDLIKIIQMFKRLNNANKLLDCKWQTSYWTVKFFRFLKTYLNLEEGAVKIDYQFYVCL